jgi:hypothetical protein
MTIGPIVVGIGLALFTLAGPGESYLATVFPAAVVFGLGLSLTVAPLTATVLGAVPDDEMGIASGVNNAVARLAGLLAVAALPAAVGLDTSSPGSELANAVDAALWWSAGLAVVGGIVAFVTVRAGREVEPTVQASVLQPCHDSARVEARVAS